MIRVLIDSKEVKQIESASVFRSLDSLCGQFELSLVPSVQNLRAFKAGSHVEVYNDSSQLMTGYIDTTTMTLGSEEKTFTLSGRDVTSILVDSSAIHDPMGFEGVTLSELASSLCEPLEIQVKNNKQDGVVHPFWYISYGETIYETLDRMAKMEGSLLLTSPEGALVITKPNLKSESIFYIKEGVNLHRVNSSRDQRGLYRTYRITHTAQGLNNQVSDIGPPLVDETVKLGKTLVIDAEGLPSTALVKKRLKYELDTRRARSKQITASVPGWSDHNKVFELGAVVCLEAGSLDLKGSFLISGLRFTLDNQSGYSTEISMTMPEAYFADPAAEIRMNQMIDLIRKDQQ